jgi:hypothetical protein
METTAPPAIGNPSKDAEHLRLLSIFHYIFGGLQIAISSIFIVHFVMGLVMIGNPTFFGHNPPPTWLGILIAAIGGAVVLLGWGLGVCAIYSGRCIAHRRKRIFSIVIAAINCLSFPFGTALGVFTIIVLMRDSVRRLYE